MPGASTVWSGNRGICIGVAASVRRSGNQQSRRGPAARVRWLAGAVTRRSGQWAQERAEPASPSVRKLEPQPQPETAFGLLTVKPAPMRVST